MTKKEQLLTDKLAEISSTLKTYTESTEQKMAELSAKIEKKHEPIYLENNINSQILSTMTSAITAALTGYNSPLNKLVSVVVDSKASDIKSVIEKAFSETISSKEFFISVREAMAHKIARNVISMNDGILDNVSNQLKNDPIFKSKAVLAISNIVEGMTNETNH